MLLQAQQETATSRATTQTAAFHRENCFVFINYLRPLGNKLSLILIIFF
jgi:hypothetical protein